MKGRGIAAERRHNERMSLAWHTVVLARPAKPPSLKSLLIDHDKADEAPRAPTALAGQMLDAFLTMQAMGAPVTVTRLN